MNDRLLGRSTAHQLLALAVVAALGLALLWAVGASLPSARAAALDQVTLPPDPPGPNLGESQKIASRRMVQAGEVFSYTIRLRNHGPDDAVVEVSDALPPGLAYQAGSADPPAEYNGPSATLRWAGVPVQGGGEYRLTYRVTVGPVITPTLITNTAVISAGSGLIERHCWTLAVRERPEPRPKLAGSRKLASQRALAAGEVLTYTIRLHNSGTAAASANIADPVPPELSYVADSASPGAVYDEASRTLSWAGVAVPVDTDRDLTFRVTAAAVTTPTSVINTAVITADRHVFQRRVQVLLVPTPMAPEVDLVPPRVHSLTIDEQDVLTSPTVTLHISATDNVGVAEMFLREWQWVALPRPRWQVVQESGWIPFQPDLPWVLGSKPGVHYVGVWVADAASNHTHMGRRGLDFANLVQPGAALPPLGLTPYLVAYEAGVDVSARLAPAAGTADLYAWYVAGPPELLGGPAQEIAFLAERAGVYLFAVRGEAGATYGLSIEPAGGPRAPAPPGPGPAAAQAGLPSVEADEILALFTASGLDPLDEAEAPASAYAVYLPLTQK